MKTKLLIMATLAVACAFAFLGCDVNKNANGIKAFSVDKEKQVIFSKGNLQYHPLNNEWRFAPNQTDYIGDANSNVAPDYDGWVDLFCWGTGANPTNVSNDYNDYQIFTDWGRNEIEGNMMGTWRTLTSDEWIYLLDRRKNAKNLKGIAQVNGVNGLIILPDNWKAPQGIIFKPSFHHEQSIEAYRQYQTLTAEQWAILEQSGAIFLPAALSRIGTVVNSIPTYGHYWTSTIDDGFTRCHFYLYSNEAGVGTCSPYVGMSVRLVKNL